MVVVVYSPITRTIPQNRFIGPPKRGLFHATVHEAFFHFVGGKEGRRHAGFLVLPSSLTRSIVITLG